MQNIYALKGFQVKVTGFTDGVQGGRGLVEANLEIGKIYTVEKTEVHSWHTDYYFQEIPGIGFSAFSCEDISTQTEENNKLHPDWKKYNS